MNPPRTGIEAFLGRPEYEYRIYMHKPWNREGFVYATNGHVIVETEPHWSLGAVEAVNCPNNIGKMFIDAFADPQWIELPELPPFKPCTNCNGTGFDLIFENGTCGDCEGYGEKFERIAVGDTGYCIRYMRLLSSLPNVKIAPNGMKACPFTFDGGRGLLMPMHPNR